MAVLCSKGMILDIDLFVAACIWLSGGPIFRVALGALTAWIVIWILAWLVLGKGSYLLGALGEKGGFEPHLKRYQDLAKLIITLATASTAFLFGFLMNRPADPKAQNVYAAVLEGAFPLAMCSLCACIFLLLIFMLGQTYIYEAYCHLIPERRNIYKGWLYALQVSVGWAGFLSLLLAHSYLAIKLVNRA
jgi:hypothetical protein